jgi:hypothetical protein
MIIPNTKTSYRRRFKLLLKNYQKTGDKEYVFDNLKSWGVYVTEIWVLDSFLKKTKIPNKTIQRLARAARKRNAYLPLHAMLFYYQYNNTNYHQIPFVYKTKKKKVIVTYEDFYKPLYLKIDEKK